MLDRTQQKQRFTFYATFFAALPLAKGLKRA